MIIGESARVGRFHNYTHQTESRHMIHTATAALFFLSFLCPAAVAASCPPPSYPIGNGKCGIDAILDAPKDPPQPSASCDRRELQLNFLWFHRDAVVSGHTAEVRGILMRVANYQTSMAIEKMRAAYKEGQKHNARVSSLIDYCDDETVRKVTHEIAEAGRIQTCRESAPARSATCADFRENLRWALEQGKTCSTHARYMVKLGLTNDYEPLRVRARYIRSGFKAAQGHPQAQDIFDSIDYIGDAIVLYMAQDYNQKTGIADGTNLNDVPEVERVCPGMKKIFRHWSYGDRP